MQNIEYFFFYNENRDNMHICIVKVSSTIGTLSTYILTQKSVNIVARASISLQKEIHSTLLYTLGGGKIIKHSIFAM